MAGEFERFKSTLLYEAQAPAEQLLADLQEIREFDKRSEKKLRTYTILICVAIAVGVGGIALSSPVVIGIAAVGLVAAIVLRVRGSRFDLANRRFELFGELVRMLSRDMPNAAPISVALDLSRPNEKRKSVGTGTAGVWQVTYYIDPWLRLNGQFADGTTYRVALVEKFQSRTKSKRSSSGKTKVKTKTKSATQTTVRLCPKRKRFQNVAQGAERVESLLQLPEWVRVKGAMASEKALILSTVTGESWDVRRQNPQTSFDGVEMVARMLLSLYQVLNVSTAPSKG